MSSLGKSPPLSPRCMAQDMPQPETPSRGLYDTNDEDLPNTIMGGDHLAQAFESPNFSSDWPLMPPFANTSRPSAKREAGPQKTQGLSFDAPDSTIPRRTAATNIQQQQGSGGSTLDELIKFNATHDHPFNSPARAVPAGPQRLGGGTVAPKHLLVDQDNGGRLAAEASQVEHGFNRGKVPHWDPEPGEDTYDWTEVDNDLRQCGLPPRGCLIREKAVDAYSPGELLDWDFQEANQNTLAVRRSQWQKNPSHKKRRIDSPLKSEDHARAERGRLMRDSRYDQSGSTFRPFSALGLHPHRRPHTVVERRACQSWKAKEPLILKRQVQPTPGHLAENGSQSRTVLTNPTESAHRTCDSIELQPCDRPISSASPLPETSSPASQWRINYDGSLWYDNGATDFTSPTERVWLFLRNPDQMDPFEGSEDSSSPMDDSRLGDRPHTAYAKLLFPDCTYYLRELSLTIGRGSRKDQLPVSTSAQVRSSGSNDDEVPQAFGQDSPPPFGGNGANNDREDNIFPGGVGGPQDQSPSKTHLRDPCRIDVYPRVDSDGVEIARKTLSRNHLRFYWNFDHRSWILEVPGRNGVGLDGSFSPKGSSIMLGDIAKIDLGSYEIYWQDSQIIGADGDSLDDSFDDSSTDVDFDINEQYDIEGRLSDDQSFLLKNSKRNGDASPAEESEEEGEEEESDVEEQQVQPQPVPKPKQKIRLSLRPSQASMRGSIAAKKSRARAQEPEEVAPKVKNEKGKRKRTPDDDDEDEEKQDEADTPQQSVEDKPTNTKRGPGRPPKDGQMSKKERRDRAKAQQLGLEYGVDEIPRKNNNRSRKKKDEDPEEAEAEEPEAIEAQPKKEKEKKKAKPRVPKPSADDEEEEEKDEPADSKEPLPPFRKSAPNSFTAQPCPNKDDLTEEQLREPGLTYAVMVCEVLRVSEEPLTLQEIYEQFKRKWPHFHFKDTNGWQSSIRHNLSPENGLKVMGKAGKGKYWAIDENAVVKQKPSKKKDPKPAMGPMPVHMGRPPFPGQPGSAYPYGYPGFGGQHIAPGMQPQGFGHGQAGPSMNQPNGAPGPFPQNQQQRPNGYMPQQQMPPNAAQNSQRPATMNAGAMNGPPGPGATHPGVAQQARPPMPMSQAPMRPTQPGNGASSTATPRAPNATPGQAPNPAARAVQNSRSRQSSTGPNQANAPANPNAPMSEAELRSRKRRVFENFRGSLVNLAPTQETRDRYNRLMNVAINFVISHPAHVHYTAPGPDQRDINNIIRMLWGTWDTHYLNPNRQEAPKEGNTHGATPSAQSGTQPSGTAGASTSGSNAGASSTATGATSASPTTATTTTPTTTAQATPASAPQANTAASALPSATPIAASAASTTNSPSVVAPTAAPASQDNAAQAHVQDPSSGANLTPKNSNDGQASTEVEAPTTNGTSPSSVGSASDATSTTNRTLASSGNVSSASISSVETPTSQREAKPGGSGGQE